MKIEIEIGETAWESNFMAILNSMEGLSKENIEEIRAKTGKLPLCKETISAHLFKLGIQAFTKEVEEGKVSYTDIVARSGTVNLISGFIQALWDHRRFHQLVLEKVAQSVPDQSEAKLCLKDAIDFTKEVFGKEGEAAVHLFQQELFLTGLESVFPVIEKVLNPPTERTQR